MLDVGHQIGGYTIMQLIGKGGMGEVYLGQHRRVARRAAIKVLIPELSQKATIVDRFFSEARATSMIRHSGIVEVIDCDVHEGQAYIIMELLEGESLGEYIHRTGPLSGDLGLALGVGVNVARAVGAAHELEMVTIIHRDLKPDNVFLHAPGTDGTTVVKVLDFGIAKLAEQGVASQTSTGVLMGTPSYMSPEQCRGAKAVDARSDIYSLGCILYEALAGTPPFVREGVGDLIIAHVSEQAVPLTALVRGLPPQIEAVIGRMMAKRPDDRHQSMAEVAEDLLTVASGFGLQVSEHLRPQKPVQKPVEIINALAATPVSGGKSTPGTGPQRILAAQGSGPHQLLGASPDPGMTAPETGLQRPPSLQTDPGTPQALSARGANASGPARVLVGRTQVMPTAEPVPDGRVKETTTLGDGAHEVAPRLPAGRKKGWPLAVGAAGIAGAVVLIVLVSQGDKGRKPGAEAQPVVEPAAPAPLPSEEPAPPPAAASAPAAAREPDMVTITLSSVPPGSTVLVDGRSSALPFRVAKGSGRHRVVVRAPSGAERTLDVDGSASRTLDVGSLAGPPSRAEREPAREATRTRSEPAAQAVAREPAKPRAEPGRPTTSSHPRDRSSQHAGAAPEAPAPAKKPAKGAAAMEAITDI